MIGEPIELQSGLLEEECRLCGCSPLEKKGRLVPPLHDPLKPELCSLNIHRSNPSFMVDILGDVEEQVARARGEEQERTQAGNPPPANWSGERY